MRLFVAKNLTLLHFIDSFPASLVERHVRVIQFRYKKRPRFRSSTLEALKRGLIGS